jgi:ABC-type glycerol-3-phosphate transport system substrate-binding protein
MLASMADTALTNSLNAAASQYFRDLQPLVETDSTFDPGDFWPGVQSACQDTEKRTLGILIEVTLYGIYVREAAFEAAGLPAPAPVWTWDDFRSAVMPLGILKAACTRSV